MYDVSPDGARFLMLKSPDGPSTPAPLSLVVVQNWLQELQQLVQVRWPAEQRERRHVATLVSVMLVRRCPNLSSVLSDVGLCWTVGLVIRLIGV
jgi:hypothetical protein